ncbi:putative DEAD box helicase involved in nonsense mediated decay [Aspergillus mulundensis]|uniref:Helicase required for RNAi-mediated heterochromatin assembly 1 n=1 Tax=Aspergillus mulundensis TaxID=1810919 RepID=A0A3D8REG9_9EURO|nr:Uncharacterized protein DSM5745_07619 [Aspergillus mulundensis]RDW72447.1 Uncharacterized protein DSM5745_07619 [Aspergillus mulundensis]
MDSDDEINAQLAERFKRTTLSSPATINTRALNARTVAIVTKDIRKYFDDLHKHDPDTLSSKPWLSKPELPSSDEIFGTDEEFVDLEPNKIEGPWESKDAYLKAHYDLIREEAVASLRDAVAIFRADPDMCDDKSVSVYEKVYVTGLTFARQGLAFKLQFSTNRAGRNIAWEYSKRLVSGSVVALSPADDAFQTKCVIAVVAARPLDGVRLLPPEVDVLFANPLDADFDPQLEWVMVEAKQGYYEASRHLMTALQKMSSESFPLSDQICSLSPHISAPAYVQNNSIVNIHSAITDSNEEGKLDILQNWPHSPLGDLDATQWDALEQMLTKQLAIIQGPPGTGKTYVSVLALRIMLSNMKADDPPIVVASQTNHALDQLLTHVSRFERQYVRLGGRSACPEIRKRTIFNIRREEPMPNFPGGTLGNAFKSHKRLSNTIAELLQPFNEANSGQPLPSTLFKKYGLLTTKQYDSLEKGAKRWVSAGQEQGEADPLVPWLGDQAAPFEVTYTKEDFGFAGDEVDLEYEQLKELEAEQGLNDDDEDESLKGLLTLLKEGFYGKANSHSNPGRYEDMWEVPVKARGGVYNELRGQLKQKILREFRQLLVAYEQAIENLRIGGWERDHIVLQNAKVLGMTTTGLSKYRALVSSMKPRIVLIEEAAQAIEGPIAAACLDSLQQLILVGDHKQLRGNCSVQDLEGDPFYLDISMFERLVNNGMPYVTLQRQRRMAPEIRQLLSPIYGLLEDHECVTKREEVPGMGNIRSFLFSHDWLESSDDMSKTNDKEAAMVVEFFAYLVLNNTPVKDITVLTFYNGQRKKILKMMKSHRYLQGHYIKVVTVDSYQGEENEVVILSLVRNGRQGIGFLSNANRVCVALSRARRGFYIFGNENLLAADELWAQVLYILGNKNPEPRVGHMLPLTYPSDWKNTNGGCELACGEKLSCGHQCALRCHSCDCEEAKRLETLAHEPAQFIADMDRGVSPKKNEDGCEKHLAIKKFQAYANGGSKEHDAILEQIAELQQRKEELENRGFCFEAPAVSGAIGHKEPDSDAQKGQEKQENSTFGQAQPDTEVDLIEF